jgi:lipid II:glycine glycyltransferase (peptidoglycan interpeptide bridge formation enzyme)
MSVTRATAMHTSVIDDAARWNDLVKKFAGCDVRQGFEWTELRRGLGWQPIRLAVFDDGEPLAACAVVARAIPLLGTVLYGSRGPLLREPDPRAAAALVHELRRAGRRVGGVVVRASPALQEGDPELVALQRAGFRALEDDFTAWNTPRCTQVLDLCRPEAELWDGIRPRVREYIRAAPRSGVRIDASEDDRDLARLYPLLAGTARLKGFPIRQRAYYESLFARYRGSGNGLMLVARLGREVIGGLLAVRLGPRVLMLATSARADGIERIRHQVAPALYWAFIQRSRALGCTLADFGPSGVRLVPRETDPGYGVYRFKASFGCRFVVYAPFQDLVLRPGAYRMIRLLERRVLPWARRARTWSGALRPVKG